MLYSLWIPPSDKVSLHAFCLAFHFFKLSFGVTYAGVIAISAFWRSLSNVSLTYFGLLFFFYWVLGNVVQLRVRYLLHTLFAFGVWRTTCRLMHLAFRLFELIFWGSLCDPCIVYGPRYVPCSILRIIGATLLHPVSYIYCLWFSGSRNNHTLCVLLDIFFRFLQQITLSVSPSLSIFVLRHAS